MWDAKTTGTNVNIRESADTSSKIKGTIRNKGTSIEVDVSGASDWLYVEYGDIKGYISAQYVHVLYGNGGCYVSVNDWLNIRQKPSTSSTALYRMYNDDAMTYLYSENGWSRVSSENGTGWAASQYIFRAA